MKTFKKFEELPVFQQSHQTALEIYKISKKFPKEEKYGITSQIKRSTSSICANIVEGLHRNTKKELIQYLYQSRASAAKSIYHLILARDLKYINSSIYDKIRGNIEEIIKQLNGWISSEKKKLNLKP